jgi:hypothetical protein
MALAGISLPRFEVYALPDILPVFDSKLFHPGGKLKRLFGGDEKSGGDDGGSSAAARSSGWN